MPQVAGITHPAARLDADAVLYMRDFVREELRQLRERTGGRSLKGQPLRRVLRARRRDLPALFTSWAEQYGVTRSAICMAVYGDTWAHLPRAVPKPRRAHA